MAMTFSSKVSAKIVEVKDPNSKEVVMTYNDSTEEVIISDAFADFNTRGELAGGARQALQKALSTYMYGDSSVIGKDRITGKDIFDIEWFYDKYGFIPKKITFARVTYEVDWETINEGYAKGRSLRITSNGGNYICPLCISAFGYTTRFEYGGRGPSGIPLVDSQHTIIPEVVIVGREFTKIPDGCFLGMEGLERVDATETNITVVGTYAFNWSERLLKRVDLSKYNTDYELNGNIHVFAEGRHRDFKHKGGTLRIYPTCVKPDFEGNVIEKLQQECESRNEEKEQRERDKVDENVGEYLCSLCGTAFPCCCVGCSPDDITDIVGSGCTLL